MYFKKLTIFILSIVLLISIEQIDADKHDEEANINLKHKDTKSRFKRTIEDHRVENLTKEETLRENMTECVGQKEFCNLSEEEYVSMLNDYIYPQTYEWILIGTHTLVFITGLVGNALVCVAVYRNHSMRTVTNYFIVNLAVADFMVILFCLPATVLWDVTETWFLGDVLCKMLLYFQSVSVTVSVLTLTFISLDRWYAICFPLKFKSTTGRAKSSIIIIWALSLTFNAPELVVLTTEKSVPLRFELEYLVQCVATWSSNSDLVWHIIKVILIYTFMQKFGFPGVVGCIDGTHVAIIRPHDNEEIYFNRKQYHSLNVLLICDADLRILHVDASFGGQSHDSHIWNNCPVKGLMQDIHNEEEVCWLLGDSGYAQRPWMMTPILNATPNSPEEHYTNTHVRTRNVIERCNGVLKTRWRCLLAHRLPLLMMTVAYHQIVKVLWRSEKIPGQAETIKLAPAEQTQLRSRRKAAKMLVAVVIMFAVCYFPVHLLSVLRYTLDMEQNDVITCLALISHVMCYANSAINPLIYNFMSGKFRREFRRAFCCSTARDLENFTTLSRITTSKKRPCDLMTFESKAQGRNVCGTSFVHNSYKDRNILN